MCPFAGPEVDFRGRFLNPFLPTDQDRIKGREYVESIECLDCAAKKHSEKFLVSLPFPRSDCMKRPR